MKLVYTKNALPVERNDVVISRDEMFVVTGWREPHKPSSTGRVYVRDEHGEHEFFPGVFDMKFIG